MREESYDQIRLTGGKSRQIGIEKKCNKKIILTLCQFYLTIT